jgi:hypothetical protein
MAAETFYDNTTRANGAIGTATSGAVWSATNFNIASNFASPTANAGIATMNVGSANNYIQVTVGGFDGSSTCYMRSRYTSSVDSYGVNLGNAGGLSFYAGSSSIASIGTYTTGDTIALLSSGSNHYVFKNNALIYSVSNATYTSGTSVSIQYTSSGTPANWKFTNISGGTAEGSIVPPIGTRMAYDRDGSTVTLSEASTLFTTLSGAQKIALNDEAITSPVVEPDHAVGQHNISVFFPESRTVTGYYLGATGFTFSAAYYSTNTTNGVDGTWTSSAVTGTTNDGTTNAYRSHYATLTTPVSCKGYRITSTGGTARTHYSLHLYGLTTAAAGVHRLAFWHPYLDIPLPPWYMDIDDIGVNTTKTRSFRLKNISTSLTANTITVASEDLTTGSGVSGQMTFTKASLGGVYSSSVSITSIASGALSEVLTVKRVTTSIQPLGLQAPRINTTITSFT